MMNNQTNGTSAQQAGGLEGILEWLQNLPFIRPFTRRFRWWEGIKSANLQESPVEVKVSSEKAIDIEPSGFDHVAFSLLTDDILSDFQEQAVFYLFDELGISWVPAQFYDHLKNHALPADALESFMREVGVSVQKVKEGNQMAIEEFQLAVGVLVELQLVKHVPHGYKEKIIQCMQQKQYTWAEDLLYVLRVKELIVDEAKKANVMFAQYRQFVDTVINWDIPFADEQAIAEAKSNLDQARNANMYYLQEQERMNGYIQQIGEYEAWIVDYTPDGGWPDADMQRIRQLNTATKDIITQLREDPSLQIKSGLQKLLGIVEQYDILKRRLQEQYDNIAYIVKVKKLLLAEHSKRGKDMIFKQYHEVMKMIEKTPVSKITRADIDKAVSLMAKFIKQHQAFVKIMELLNAQVKWLIENWNVADESWQEDNSEKFNNMFSIKDKILSELESNPNYEILQGLTFLKGMTDDYYTFINALKDHSNGFFHDPNSADNIQEKIDQALVTLGFEKGSKPDLKQVKSAFRKVVKRFQAVAVEGKGTEEERLAFSALKEGYDALLLQYKK